MYGEERPEVKASNSKSKKDLPHIKDRLKEDSNDSENEEFRSDEEENELTRRYESSVIRRRKYRDDDEVKVS